MGSVSAFIVSFCGGCILLGFLYMLCPSGNMSTSVRYIFCLCFVCMIAASAISIPTPDFLEFDETQTENILTEQNVAATAQIVFGEALENNNIVFRKIVVNTNKTVDGSIVINRVTIYTDESSQRVMEVIGSENYEVVVLNE